MAEFTGEVTLPLKKLLSIPLLGVLAIAPRLLAQASPDVSITIPDKSVAIGPSILRVNVTIPPGYFIPAETTPDTKGAWLKTDYWVFNNPRYPTPEPVTISGKRVLAYTGTMRIAIPVAFDPRMSPVLPLSFGYQLCRRAICEEFRVKDAGTRVVAKEAEVPPQRIAFAIDKSHVAVVLPAKVKVSSTAKVISSGSRFSAQLFDVSATRGEMPLLTRDWRANAGWVISSNGRRFDAVVERHAGHPSSCGDMDAADLTLVLRVMDPSFSNEQPKYFVAVPSDAAAPVEGAQLGPIRATLSPAQERVLVELIKRHMRATLPWFFAPDSRGLSNLLTPTLSALLNQIGPRPVFQIEGYRLAPDANLRLRVRAYWTPSPPPVGITLWVKFDGTTFNVEGADAKVSRFAFMNETKDFSLAGTSEYAGVVLNVASAQDGWAYLLEGEAGYEGAGVSLLKYSPFGPRSTGVVIGHGC